MKQFVLKKNGNEFDEESKKYEQSRSSDSLGGDISMGKKGYREPIKASLEEILERNAQINEIRERFDKLKKDIAKSSNPDDLAKIESEFKEYLKSLGSAYEVAISPMLDIEAHANPSICAVGSLFDLSSDQTIDCFESAVDAFQDRLQQKIRSYCDINNANKRGKCYVH